MWPPARRAIIRGVERMHAFDRRLGRTIRAAADTVPGGRRAGVVAGDALAPLFEGLVAGMLVRPAARPGGVAALASGALAAGAARVARDRIGRPRPGTRPDGGLPSRHAAAAVAIARAAGRRHPRLRPWLAVAAIAGLGGRVVSGHHDPADIVAGAALGVASDWITERTVGRWP